VYTAPLVLVPLAAGAEWVILTMLFAAEFISGFGVMALDISVTSIFATVIPDQLRSRVTGAFQMVSFGTRPLGAVTGGFLATAIGMRPTLFVAAIGGMTGFICLLPSPLPGYRIPVSPEHERDASVGAEGH
jgi:MFS family permease